jgi:hypothetical protein
VCQQPSCLYRRRSSWTFIQTANIATIETVAQGSLIHLLAPTFLYKIPTFSEAASASTIKISAFYLNRRHHRARI